MHIIRKLLPILLLLVCSCRQAPVYVPKQMDVVSGKVMELNFKKIEFVSQYSSSYESPFVEHLMPIQIPYLVSSWVDSNIRITGQGDKILKIVLKDYAVKEVRYFDKTEEARELHDGLAKYQLNFECSFEVYDVSNLALPEKNLDLKYRNKKYFDTDSDPVSHLNLLQEMETELSRELNSKIFDSVEQSLLPYSTNNIIEN